MDYYFNKKRKYKVDFELPFLKLLIEIKDNHIWYRKEVESGKWQLKENSAKLCCSENNYEYKLIFDVNSFIQSFHLQM